MTRYSKVWIAACCLATVAFAGCTNDEDLGGRSDSDAGLDGGGSDSAKDSDGSSSASDDGGASCIEADDCVVERCDCTSGFTKQTLEVQPKCVGDRCMDRESVCTDACSGQGLQWLP